MVLYPLAVVLIAQLGILLLVIIFYQRLQKKRLLKELEGFKGADNHQEPHFAEHDGQEAAFDKEQAALLLNRLNQNSADITSEAPAAKELCQHQKELVEALSDCLQLRLEPADEPSPIIPDKDEADDSDDILSQADLDEALGESPEELEGLEDFEGLEDLDSEPATSEPASPKAEAEEYDPLINPEKADMDKESELPEDTLQKTLDNLDEFDFSGLEEELLKDDDQK
ncbi:hypothetical protein SAMN05660443_0071 [Marinospirillum celere]|uniref:Uncharacterized protein n=1 Tax=Marinospirillum celere TaxID=1122252 RepID=A0A1I1DYC9_9GAMM|nr:hypothetical protein [Marinospirillum celere]SFB77998.1 hypothetical protein SAMN05660443_0071 [Marinospirillum celere]